MIVNDAEFAAVRTQLDDVEAIIASLRREVLPKNPKLYHLMAESYIDLHRKFRLEIDHYLGLAVPTGSAPSSIELEGTIAASQIS